MKIIISDEVFKASNEIGGQIARMIAPDISLPSLEQAMTNVIDGSASFKHYRVLNTHEGLMYEIDDKVVLAVLRLYGHFAHAVSTVVTLVKALAPGVIAKYKEVEALANELK